MALLPRPEHLDPLDALPDPPLLPDGALDLRCWMAQAAVLRTLARRLGLDPDGGVTLRRSAHGWLLATASRCLHVALRRGVWADVVVAGLPLDDDTPEGRRRAVVRLWRALAAHEAAAVDG